MDSIPAWIRLQGAAVVPQAPHDSPHRTNARDVASAPRLGVRVARRERLGLDGLALGPLGALAPRVVAAGLEGAVAALALDQRFAADRAGLVQQLRLRPGLPVLLGVRTVGAFGVAGAGQEDPVAAGALHQLLLAAARTGLAGRLRRLAVLAADALARRVAGAA